MKNLIVASIVSGVSVLCLAAAPDRHEPSFTISGAGSRPCADWTAIRAKLPNQDPAATVDKSMMVSWIQGFLNGMNVMHAGNGILALEPPDGPSIREFIDRYCKDKPASRILDATIQLYLSADSR